MLFFKQKRLNIIRRLQRPFALTAVETVTHQGEPGQSSKSKDFLFAGKIFKKVENWLLRNNAGFDFWIFFITLLLFFSLLFVICLLFKPGIFIFFPVAALTIFLVYAFIDLRGRKISKKKESQMEGFMIELMGYLYTNPNVLVGIQKAAENAEEPLKKEFMTVVDDVRRGSRLAEALGNLLARNRSKIIQVIITGLIAAGEKGADLVVFLKDQIDYLREKRSIENYIRILSSGPRYTSYIIAAIPLAVVVLISVLNRNFITDLLHGIGLYVVIYTVLSYSAGFFIINKIVNSGFKSDSSIN